MGELAESCASDDDEGGRADKGDEVEGQEDDELDDLDYAPGRVDCGRGWFAEHFDGGWGICEEDAMGGDEIRQ